MIDSYTLGNHNRRVSLKLDKILEIKSSKEVDLVFQNYFELS